MTMTDALACDGCGALLRLDSFDEGEAEEKAQENDWQFDPATHHALCSLCREDNDGS